MTSFGNLYASLFSKGVLSKVNNRVLALALRARGYNNWRNNDESGETYFIRKVLGEYDPKLCIDIGANVGRYSIEILNRTEATVIAFEPLPLVYQDLERETKSFGNRIILEKKGVGNSNGELTIHYNPSALALASFSTEVNQVSYVSNADTVFVPVVTLDSYCEQNKIEQIDLIKVDTEGFESEVFQGANRVLSELKPKFIQIEFNWHHLFRNKSLNYFAEKLPDYKVYQLVPNGWRKRNPKDPLSNIYHFSNFVFVRND